MTVNELAQYVFSQLDGYIAIGGEVVPVYDATPTSESMPYIAIAGIEVEAAEPTKSGASAFRATVEVEIFSAVAGFREVYEIQEQVDAQLRDPPPATGPAPWIMQTDLDGFDSFRADIGEGRTVRAGSYRRSFLLTG